MKQFFSGMLITLALVLAIVVGVVAIAESAETEAPQLPATEQAPAEVAPEAEASSTESTDSTALKEALDAYNAARQSSKVEGLEAELKGYVESGKLTQEQADLILNYYKEQESLRNGTCPNCGYQFQSRAASAAADAAAAARAVAAARAATAACAASAGRAWAPRTMPRATRRPTAWPLTAARRSRPTPLASRASEPLPSEASPGPGGALRNTA